MATFGSIVNEVASETLIKSETTDAGWEPIPKGTKGGQRKKRLGRQGYEYRYPDGRGGWTSKVPDFVDPINPKLRTPSTKERVKKKNWFARTRDRIAYVFSSKQGKDWLDAAREAREGPIEDEAAFEREERLHWASTDKTILSYIARSKNINQLLSMRDLLIEMGAKEPSPRKKKREEDDTGKKQKTAEDKSKKPRQKRERTPEQIRKASLNKMLAVVNKRLSQIAPDIIAKESERRVEDYLEDLAEQRRQELLEAEREPEKKKSPNRRLGFLVSAKEVDTLEGNIELKDRTDGVLFFEDEDGSTFYVDIDEIDPKELNKILDRVDEHPELKGLKDYTKQTSLELRQQEYLDDVGIDPDAEFPKNLKEAVDDVPGDFKAQEDLRTKSTYELASSIIDKMDYEVSDIDPLPPGFEPVKRNPVTLQRLFEEEMDDDTRRLRALTGRESLGYGEAQDLITRREAEQDYWNAGKPALHESLYSVLKEVKDTSYRGNHSDDARESMLAHLTLKRLIQGPPGGDAPTTSYETTPMGDLFYEKDTKIRGSLETGMPSENELIAQAMPDIESEPVDLDLEVPLGLEGKRDKVYMTGRDGSLSEVESEWTLIEADDLITSHDPETFKPDDRHIGNERAYHRDESEQVKVIMNAKNLRPDLVVNNSPDSTSGAPVIDQNGVVLGGNSRSMSMKQVYKRHKDKAKELRDHISDNAEQFGFSKEAVSSLKNPILVRKVSPRDDDHKKLLVRQLNESFIQAMDPRTMAVAQARRFDERAIDSLATQMKPDETLAAFLTSSRGNSFIDSLQAAGIISETNKNAYISQKTKKLNENGRSLVENVIVGKVIPNADLLTELPQKTMRSIARSAPYVLSVESMGEKYGIRDHLEQAVSALTSVRAAEGGLHPTDTEQRKKALSSWARQQDWERDHPAKSNPKAMAILETIIEKPGPIQMSRVFRQYAQAVKTQEDGSIGFDFFQKDPSDIFHEVFGSKQKESTPKEPSELKTTRSEKSAQESLITTEDSGQGSLI